MGGGVAALGGGRPFGGAGAPAQAREKHYVSVVMSTSREGQVTPLRVLWEDGRAFDVEEIVDERWARDPGSPRRARLYVVLIAGKWRRLYHENPRWFVMARTGRPA